MKVISPVDDHEIELLVLPEEESVDDNAAMIEALEKTYRDLTLQSWKCFGLKLAVPLLALLTSGSAILMFLHAASNKTDEGKVRDTTIGILSGVASVGLFSFGLKQGKLLHQQQNSIDQEREKIGLEIAFKKS